MEDEITPEHLGDGVYVSFDGHQIAISVNDHRNPPVVYLEPGVMRNLIAFSQKISEAQQKFLQGLGHANGC